MDGTGKLPVKWNKTDDTECQISSLVSCRLKNNNKIEEAYLKRTEAEWVEKEKHAEHCASAL